MGPARQGGGFGCKMEGGPLSSKALGGVMTEDSRDHWSVPPFGRFLDYLRNIDQVLYVSMRGIDQLTRMVPLHEALLGVDDESDPDSIPEESARRLGRVRWEAEFSKAEVEAGFPILHAHSIVAVWGALEAMVQDVVLCWLRNKPELLSQDALSGIKIQLAQYEAMETEDRLEYLLRQFENETRTKYKAGVSRFESLLQLVELSGPVDDDLSRILFELSNVRNVIVHRAAKADKRLVESCPWLPYKVGQEIQLSNDDYVRYRDAANDYLGLLMVRGLRHRGLSEDEARKVVFSSPVEENSA